MSRWLTAEEQRAWRGLLRMTSQLNARMNRQLLQDYGISLTDYEVLVVLSEASAGRLRVFEIADALAWEQSRVSHQLARMQRRGLITRADCASDARGAFAVLTADGRAAIERAAPAHVETVRQLVFDGLSHDQVTALTEITTRVLDRLAATAGGRESLSEDPRSPGSLPRPAGNVKHGSRSPGRLPALRRGGARLMTPLGSQQESETGRLEAFSDGVLAVIITIMALELKAPVKGTFASLHERLPALLIYILSFTFIGIWWNNHHHLLRAARRVTGGVMWANLHLLFWLSLIPVLTEWIGENYRESAPAATYGFVCVGAAVAFTILVRAIIRADGSTSLVAAAIGRDVKGRASLAIYAAATVLAFVSPWISYALFVVVAVIWFVPDRRFADR